MMNHTFDPCHNIDSLNLTNPDDLKQILFRDKHTRVEGICAEAIFFEDLLSESFPVFSTGWWFRQRNGQFRVVKMLPDVESLSELDFALLSFFASKAVPTFVVSFDEQEKDFFYAGFNARSLQDFLDGWQVNRKVYPRHAKTAPLPSRSTRQPDRLNQAASLLEDFGLLKRAAIERLFANCWLASGSYWDIDAFVIHEDRILAFEVKQKYPTRAGTFGLNVGLSQLFTFLSEELGVEVIHVVLTKPISDYKIPAIDFYTTDRYKNLSLWIAAKFQPGILSTHIAEAPARTSIYTSQNLKFYHVSPRHFHRLKIFGSGPSKALLEFVNGKTSALSGVEDIPVLEEK